MNALEMMDPSQWVDVYTDTPPIQWDFFAADSKYYWGGTASGHIYYIGDEPEELDVDVTVHWEILEATDPTVAPLVLTIGDHPPQSIGNTVGTGSFVVPAGTNVATGIIAEGTGIFSWNDYGGSVAVWYTQDSSPVSVPDVVGMTLAAATSAITAATLVVGVVTYVASSIVAAGLVISQSPLAGATAESGDPVSVVISTGPGIIVPNVIGQTVSTATATLAGSTLVLGAQSFVYDAVSLPGTVIGQTPVAGTEVEAGSAVDVLISLGPAPVIVPCLEGLSPAEASLALANATLRTGEITFVSNSELPINVVVSQTIPCGTSVGAGTLVGFGVNVFLLPFKFERTVISQYINSPTIMAMVENMYACIDPRTNMAAFYTFVWNVDTAQGFGLDIWGKIVGVSRLLRIPNSDRFFGFTNASVPADWTPFNNSPFYAGQSSSQAYLLPDDTYRTLILTKALSNIVATNAASMNQLLRNLFPGRGKAYVRDDGDMAMTFVFEFALTTAEYAILTESGALPHPAGVSYSVEVDT